MPGMVATAFGRHAIGSPADTPIYSGPYVQSVDAVADIVAGVIEHPVAEVYTNPSFRGDGAKVFRGRRGVRDRSGEPLGIGAGALRAERRSAMSVRYVVDGGAARVRDGICGAGTAGRQCQGSARRAAGASDGRDARGHRRARVVRDRIGRRARSARGHAGEFRDADGAQVRRGESRAAQSLRLARQAAGARDGCWRRGRRRQVAPARRRAHRRRLRRAAGAQGADRLGGARHRHRHHRPFDFTHLEPRLRRRRDGFERRVHATLRRRADGAARRHGLDGVVRRPCCRPVRLGRRVLRLSGDEWTRRGVVDRRAPRGTDFARARPGSRSTRESLCRSRGRSRARCTPGWSTTLGAWRAAVNSRTPSVARIFDRVALFGVPPTCHRHSIAPGSSRSPFSSARRCRSPRKDEARDRRNRRSICPPTHCSRASDSDRSDRRAWAAASTTSRCRRAIRTSSTSATPSAACSSPTTTACRSSRCSRRTAAASIGDIAIHPTNPDIVYVGTGEPNNRQTSSFGDGIYKSTDGGKTFTNIGLKETQTIARIVIDPRNPEVVYVAAPGHLFGPNAERGLYKTTDGGKTWNKIKYIDENTGFTDIAHGPVELERRCTPRATSAAARAAASTAAGPGSALWKTTTPARAGRSSRNGLAAGHVRPHRARLSASNPNVVYAQIEAGESGTELRGRRRRRGRDAGRRCRRAAAAAWRGGVDWQQRRPGRRVASDGILQQRRAAASRRRRTTPALPALDPKLGGVFRSDNKGRTWKLVSNCNSRPMYFSQLRVDPENDNNIYVAGTARREVARRRQDVRDARRRGRLRRAGARRPARDLGRPAELEPHHEATTAGSTSPTTRARTGTSSNTMATGLAYWVSADMGIRTTSTSDCRTTTAGAGRARCAGAAAS